MPYKTYTWKMTSAQSARVFTRLYGLGLVFRKCAHPVVGVTPIPVDAVRLGRIKVKVSLSFCTHAANLDFTFIEHDPHSRRPRACDRAWTTPRSANPLPNSRCPSCYVGHTGLAPVLYNTIPLQTSIEDVRFYLFLRHIVMVNLLFKCTESATQLTQIQVNAPAVTKIKLSTYLTFEV